MTDYNNHFVLFKFGYFGTFLSDIQMTWYTERVLDDLIAAYFCSAHSTLALKKWLSLEQCSCIDVS